MMPLICPSCGGRMDIEAEKKLVPFSCPYCEARLSPEKNGQAVYLKLDGVTEPQTHPSSQQVASQARDPSPYLKEAQEVSDPVRRYALLKKAEEAAPEDLRVQKALLLHGRLHERDRRKVDFSVIKCYLLHVFEAPQEYSLAQREQKLKELLEEDRLQRAMTLAGDPHSFLREYLTTLSGEYIRLFLKGSSRHMKPIFGFAPAGKPQKLLAEPVAAMIGRMLSDSLLSAPQKETLSRSFYAGFVQEFQGETLFLDEALGSLLHQVKD